MAVDAVPIVEQMCQRWAKSCDELLAAYRDTFADGCEYLVQQDTPILVGAGQAVAAIEAFHLGFGVETIEVDLLKIVQVGERRVERADRLHGQRPGRAVPGDPDRRLNDVQRRGPADPLA